ncbi:MAG: nuclear transport factor 2 family protein [Bacteroides sp.]|nr:nuclear transport factor 2 family protein [Bacteroides sp.]
MRTIFFTLLLFGYTSGTFVQDEVNFEFSDGITNVSLKNRMEQQVMNLLTAINRAETTGGDINYSGINIDDLASQSINMLWNNVHFRCVDDDIVERCLQLRANNSVRGYQVRNIAIVMKPLDDTYTDNLNQQVCINFDATGKIVDFNITMGIQQYSKFMKEGTELNDMDKRMQIVNYLEQLRTAYNQKDIQFMENIFSEDALIITGKVVQRRKAEIGIPEKDVEYIVQRKQEYLSNLRGVFKRQGYINVKFNDYRIKRHGAKPNYYGVTLIQEWNSTTYSDKGILFLIWDFTDEDAPQIHVRTWQPTEISEDEIFTLNKFKLP